MVPRWFHWRSRKRATRACPSDHRRSTSCGREDPPFHECGREGNVACASVLSLERQGVALLPLSVTLQTELTRIVRHLANLPLRRCPSERPAHSSAPPCALSVRHRAHRRRTGPGLNSRPRPPEPTRRQARREASPCDPQHGGVAQPLQADPIRTFRRAGVGCGPMSSPRSTLYRDDSIPR